MRIIEKGVKFETEVSCLRCKTRYAYTPMDKVKTIDGNYVVCPWCGNKHYTLIYSRRE